MEWADKAFPLEELLPIPEWVEDYLTLANRKNTGTMHA
jgi:hypothetical protein